MLPQNVPLAAGVLHLLDPISDAIIMVDGAQQMVLVNRSAVHSFGYPAEWLRGQPFDVLLTPAAADVVRNQIRAFAAQAAPGSAQPLSGLPDVWLRSNGGTFPADVTLVKLSEEEPMSVTLILHDRSEQERAQADLQQAEARYRSLVESVQDYAIFLLDSEGRVASWNSGAEQIIGYHTEEIIGQHFRCFFPEEAIQQHKPEHELGIAATQGRYIDEAWRVRKDGSRFWANVVLAAICDEQGKVYGFSKVTRDITEQQEVEAALRHYTARLNVLYEISRAILTAQSPEAIAEATVRRIRHLVTCQCVNMVTHDEASGELQVLATEYEELPPTTTEALLLPTLRQGLPTLQQGQIYYLPDIHRALAPEQMAPEWHITGLRSYLSVPLLARGVLIGVITLAANAPGAFGSDVLDVVRQVADQLAVALQNARLFAEVRTGREQLQGLSHRLIEVQEMERRTIAGELHDEIGQALTLVKMHLQAAQDAAGTAAPNLTESIGIVEHALQQVRDLSLDLRPSLLDDLGLVAALRWYGARQARLADVSFHFTGLLPEERLPTTLETTCFRVAQEALTNIIRHARAQHVWVRVQIQDAALQLTIRDDGVGFDPHAAQVRARHGQSFGLLGMRERVAIAGGAIQINSAPERGTTITACFPLYAGTKEESA